MQFCGLWHAHVKLSVHNDFGKCECLGCFGSHCHSCKTYARMQSLIMYTFEKTKCDKCLGR